MSKNIVLCCDGTANEFAEANTNVVKLYSTLLYDSGQQVSYYHPGIGTMEAPAALTTVARQVTKGLGLAFGYGLENDIRDAYVFLMKYYEPGDKVFLFGFSRGAYTVRAVASLLHMYGLVAPGNEAQVPYILRLMLGIQRTKETTGAIDPAVTKYLDLASDFKRMMVRRECKPWFVGVWDTVSSVGWVANPLKLPFVTNNPDIQIGRHAIAIDERRAFFRSHLWRPSDKEPSGPKDLKQVWFPGVHCDVGGGYPEAESGLAKEALQWMMDEAEDHGLLVDAALRAEILGQTEGSKYVRPNPAADRHESLKGFWKVAEYVPKPHYDFKTGTHEWRANKFRRRTIPAKSLVHASAYERGAEYQKLIPADAVRVDRKPAAPAPPTP